MCIILTVEKYVKPDYDLIETCFWNNPDGAGLMWTEGGRVCTAKGFSDPYELHQAILDTPEDSRLVVHMRIATSGGIDVGTCHPFPITDELDVLHAANVECDAAIAHNGIISGMPTDAKLGISDTVSFVSTIVTALYDVDDAVTKSMCRRIKEAAPGNRFAIMTDDGEVYRLGVGWETVTKGIQASNGSWRYDRLLKWTAAPKSRSYYGGWDSIEWEDDYYDGYYDYYGTWHPFKTDEEPLYYEDLMDKLCPDCMNKGNCLVDGPVCEDVAHQVDRWMEGKWNESNGPDEDADWVEWSEYRMANA